MAGDSADTESVRAWPARHAAFVAGWSALALAAMSASCATTLYEGPPLSSSAGATVESVNTEIDEIDGKDVRAVRGEGRARYLLPPGPHLLEVSLPGARGAPATGSSSSLHACLLAVRGRLYRTVAREPASAGEPAIVEIQSSPGTHGAPAVLPQPTGCERERLFPEDDGLAPEETGEPGALPATSAPAQAERSVRHDVLRLWSRHRIQPRVGRRPFVDLSFAMTWAGGGDEVASARLSDGSTEGIDAGTGFLMSVNGMVTPVWLRDVVGFGAGGELGFKVWDITASNGQITLKRYPAMATLHTALRLDDDWFVFLAGGVEKDLGVELSGSGVASGIGGLAVSHVGAVGRLMFYGRLSDSVASMLGLIVSRVTYDAGAGAIDASSVGLTLALTLAL